MQIVCCLSTNIYIIIKNYANIYIQTHTYTKFHFNNISI